MANSHDDNDTLRLPPASSDQTYVSVSALNGGYLTLPERLFVTDADPEKRATVPSLAFLIQHPRTKSNLVFDLGLKRDLTGYAPAQQAHISNRQPTTLHPDVADSLHEGGLEPAEDIDTVVLSHVHWDHVGTPSDFAKAQFVVGAGTLDLLANGDGPHYPAEIFNKDELPRDRTTELPSTSSSDSTPSSDANGGSAQSHSHVWRPLGLFPHAIDFYGDASLYIVDAPGHLTGHVNLLARVAERKWVYLGGDCCHDPRILTGEKGIAMYDDGHGGSRSVHKDTDEAARTVRRVGRIMKKGAVVEGEHAAQVEVVVAHDGIWAEGNKNRFWPGRL